ncbi:hypothetical protein WJX82_010684 [Trebouxia sp. C0006]
MLSKKGNSSHLHFVPARVPSTNLDKGALLAYSPVAAMLDRFKTAEAAWNQEKAQYRHEAEVQRKKANKLQFEFEKLQTAHRHQSSELKAMMTALKSRDGQLATAQRQLQGLQEADANDKQSLADVIATLRGERQELSELLDAASHRVSHLEAAHVQHGSKEASLKDKVLALEGERTKAAADAYSAVSEVSMGSSGSDEEDSDDDSSAEHRMEDLLRAFHVNEQQRNMPPSLLPNGGLKKHKSRRHSPSQKKGRK